MIWDGEEGKDFSQKGFSYSKLFRKAHSWFDVLYSLFSCPPPSPVPKLVFSTSTGWSPGFSNYAMNYHGIVLEVLLDQISRGGFISPRNL